VVRFTSNHEFNRIETAHWRTRKCFREVSASTCLHFLNAPDQAYVRHPKPGHVYVWYVWWGGQGEQREQGEQDGDTREGVSRGSMFCQSTERQVKPKSRSFARREDGQTKRDIPVIRVGAAHFRDAVERLSPLGARQCVRKLNRAQVRRVEGKRDAPSELAGPVLEQVAFTGAKVPPRKVSRLGSFGAARDLECYGYTHGRPFALHVLILSLGEGFVRGSGDGPCARASQRLIHCRVCTQYSHPAPRAVGVSL
jgi:hypothetical protein